MDNDDIEALDHHLGGLAESSRYIESFAAQLPALWRRSKFRIKGLKKSAQYNDMTCIVKAVEGGRLRVQILDDNKANLSILRVNVELQDAGIDSSEPEISQALERLRHCRDSSISRTREGVSSATVNWARGLLDVTYQVEIKIIDAEFVDRDGFIEVCRILPGSSS
jgi:hypothetical protein